MTRTREAPPHNRTKETTMKSPTPSPEPPPAPPPSAHADTEEVRERVRAHVEADRARRDEAEAARAAAAQAEAAKQAEFDRQQEELRAKYAASTAAANARLKELKDAQCAKTFLEKYVGPFAAALGVEASREAIRAELLRQSSSGDSSIAGRDRAYAVFCALRALDGEALTTKNRGRIETHLENLLDVISGEKERREWRDMMARQAASRAACEADFRRMNEED